MASRIVIEEPCEHGKDDSHYLPHDDHQGPHVLQNRYGPDCPHCPGGSRRVLDPRLYRTDPWTKRTVDRINALALEGEDASAGGGS